MAGIEGARCAFKSDTGFELDALGRRSSLEAMIDEATGYEQLVIVSFADWVAKHHWGEEEGFRLRPGTCVRFTREFRALVDANRAEFTLVRKWQHGEIVSAEETPTGYRVKVDTCHLPFQVTEDDFETIPRVDPSAKQESFSDSH